MRKILVCVLILQFKGSCFFQLHIFTTTHIVFGFNRWAGVWGKLTPMKWDVFMNFTQLVCNSQSVWGKITPMKWAVFIKLYPMSKARMSLSKNLPQTSKKFTQIYLPYLWLYATLTTPAVMSPSDTPCSDTCCILFLTKSPGLMDQLVHSIWGKNDFVGYCFQFLVFCVE